MPRTENTEHVPAHGRLEWGDLFAANADLATMVALASSTFAYLGPHNGAMEGGSKKEQHVLQDQVQAAPTVSMSCSTHAIATE